MSSCPFCERINDGSFEYSNPGAVAFRDAYPVSQGHTLVVPRFHLPSLFELSEPDQVAVWSLVTEVRTALVDELKPHGFNVGLNDGQAAGQTVFHAHVHVIPRYSGDVADPSGGVRWIIPGKGRYVRTPDNAKRRS